MSMMGEKPSARNLAILREHLADLTIEQLCEVLGQDRDELIDAIVAKAATSDKMFCGMMLETQTFIEVASR